MSALELEVRKRLGPFSLEVALSVPARGVLVLVGESGSGKTTLLRILAGLITPDAGRIAVGECVWFDGERGVDRPARERAIGFVAQDYALFPHLDARDNVAFGLRAQGRGAKDANARAEAALGRVGIAELARRMPGSLSGGQQQRVALARALVLEPALLLLDEPLSALDLKTRHELRAELRRLLGELDCASLFVTHSPAEALAFGERIAVLEAGRITQLGTRDDLLLRPRSRYVAEFLGTNLFRVRAVARLVAGIATLSTDDGELFAAVSEDDEPLPADGGFAVVDPREITLSLGPPEGSAQNVMRGTVEDLVLEPPHGERLRVRVSTRPRLVAEITRPAAERLALALGTAVYASYKATGVRVFR